MAVNKENIQKTIDLLKDTPAENFNMSNVLVFAKGTFADSQMNAIHACGSAACMLGFGQVAMNPTRKVYVGNDNFNEAEEKAVYDWWGVSYHQGKALCFGFGLDWLATKEEAIDCLEDLIKGGIISWRKLRQRVNKGQSGD